MSFKFFADTALLNNNVSFNRIPPPINKLFMRGEGLVNSVELQDVYYVVTPVILQSAKQRETIARIGKLAKQEADIEGALALLPKAPGNEIDDVNEDNVGDPSEDDSLDMYFLEDGIEEKPDMSVTTSNQNELTALGLKIEAIPFYTVIKSDDEETASFFRIPIATIDCDFPNLNDIPGDEAIDPDDWWAVVRNAYITDYDAKMMEIESKGYNAKKMLEKVAQFLASRSSAASAVGEFSSDPNIEKANAARNKALSEFLSAVEDITHSPADFETLILGETDEDKMVEFTHSFGDFYQNLKGILEDEELDKLALNTLNFENEIRKFFLDLDTANQPDTEADNE